MTEYHEQWEALSTRVRDMHRALASLKEEIEAVDWYNQRADLCDSDELRAVLVHNRDEEIEHACMTLEWLRRNMDGWDEQLKTYLFKQEPITEIEEAVEGSAEAPAVASSAPKEPRALGLGSLKGR